MSLSRRFRRTRRAGENAPADDPSMADDRVDELAERLRAMRGDSVTAMGAGTGGARSGDPIRSLTRAARDNRYVDRSVDDDVLTSVKEYRSSNDPK